MHDRDFADARRNFEAVWNPSRSRRASPAATEPSVEELLDVDCEYRARVVSMAGLNAAPELRIERDGRHYLARFARPSLSNGHAAVIKLYNSTPPGRVYTIVTGTRGLFDGRRVVRGRENECRLYYLLPARLGRS